MKGDRTSAGKAYWIELGPEDEVHVPDYVWTKTENGIVYSLLLENPTTTESGEKKKVLTVVMENRWETYVHLIHEDEKIPYGKRTVQIELTAEQMEQIKPRKVGQDGKEEKFEEIGSHWLEDK